jgi:hypothetical protein
MRKVLIVTGVVISLAYASIALAWTAPTAAPPNGNISAPINTGSVEQVKTGSLTNIQLTSVSGAPSPVTNRLYNVGGTLYFNGSPIGGSGSTAVNGSGTANYISKFTGASALGNSQIIDNGAEVGINVTPGPTAKFEVYGPGKSWGGYFTGANSGIYVSNVGTNNWAAQFYSPAYGVYSQAGGVNTPAVQGSSPNGYGGYFSGNIGLYAQGSNSSYGYTGHPSYGGFFSGPHGVYSQNQVGYYTYLDYAGSSWGLYTNGNTYAADYYVAATGQWLSTISNGRAFGGMFTTWAANPYTGGGSCPAGTNLYTGGTYQYGSNYITWYWCGG